MLDKYIVAVEINTEDENIVLIDHDDYDIFTHEPITGSDDREEAEKLLADVKELGVSSYLNKVIADIKKQI